MGRPRLKPSEKVNRLPARYRADQRIASWPLAWDSALGIKVMGELLTLAQDLGGWDRLSRQRQILVERVVFLHLKAVEYEAANLQGQSADLDAGTYSNYCNVLMGHLKNLGLDRVARDLPNVATYLAAKAGKPEASSG